jgi:hypothetical protein
MMINLENKRRESVYKWSFVLFIFFGFTVSQVSARQIEKYERYTAIGVSKKDNHTYLILRKISYKDQIQFFAVDPDDLSTSIKAQDTLNVVECPLQTIMDKFSASPYVKALMDAESNSTPLQDAGITHFVPASHNRLDLTIDLCPSKHPLDRAFFNKLIEKFSKEERPVPLAVAVTGIWMERHESDLKWLVGLEKDNILSITWINHSYNHRTEKNLPLKRNFLLKKGTDIDLEVLQTERKMIEEGIIPSIFFRFPGLISSADLFKKIISYGLAPVGTDAWLGKNQWPKDGSIVLVHANGNEPVGIKKFLDLINKKGDGPAGKWQLFDLRETVAETEKEGPYNQH